MALSVHSSSHATWDRTLPNPAALRPNGAEPRRSSSLLQHHISSAQFMTPAADESGRHASVPYTSPMKASEKEQDQEEHPRVRQRQDSAISDDSMTDFSSEEPGPAENPPGYCLCVPEPKIPRPRNGESDDDLPRRVYCLLIVSSFHSLPSTSTRRSRRTASETT